jgi:hypothetical protein
LPFFLQREVDEYKPKATSEQSGGSEFNLLLLFADLQAED